MEDKNFATLSGKDEYARYFNQLSGIFRLLESSYRAGSSAELFERLAVTDLLHRLLTTVESLRMKYACARDSEASLRVDLTESGFPNFSEISAVRTDLARRDIRRREIPNLRFLKRDYLDELFRTGEEPRGALELMCERGYLDSLRVEKIFQPFTLGAIELNRRAGARTDQLRGYVVSWGSYDFVTNRPYLHLMTLEQDGSADPLDEDGPDRKRFLEVLEFEGGRAVDVGIMAAAIDQAIETVHPKILKRICIGPLYSRFLLEGREPNLEDPREMAIRAALEKLKKRSDDLILFLTDEIVFSKRQEVSRSVFAPGGKVREIFAISDDCSEAYRRRASVVRELALLPHSVLQLLSKEDAAEIPGFSKSRKITYDHKGRVHGI